MGDSRSEDPPEGPSVLYRMIPFLGSARRPTQSGSAHLRSAITPGEAQSSVGHASTSSSHRPDPAGERAESFIPSSLPPHVRPTRGQPGGGEFSLLGSVSASLQHQVHRLEDGFDAALRLSDEPVALTPIVPPARYGGDDLSPLPSQIDISTPSPSFLRDDEDYSLFDSFEIAGSDPSVVDSSLSFPGPQGAGLTHTPLAATPRRVTITTPVPCNPRHGTPVSPRPRLPHSPSIWYNTDATPAVKSGWMTRDVAFDITETAPAGSRGDRTRHFSLCLTKSPKHLQWSCPVGLSMDIVIYLKTDPKGKRCDPRVVLLCFSISTNRLFGVRLNLDTGVRQAFPLLLRGDSWSGVGTGFNDELTVFHPYLHGFHSSDDYSSSTSRGIYGVPVSWGGPQVVRSFALAWALWADFKYRASSEPDVADQCRTNPSPTPFDSIAAADAANRRLQILRARPYCMLRPQLPHYVESQFAEFGITHPHGLTSLESYPEPRRDPEDDFPGDCTFQGVPPEVDTPSVGGGSTSARSIHSTGSSGSTTTATEDGFEKSRQTTISHVSKSYTFKLPQDPKDFPLWSLNIKAEMLGEAWQVDGEHITKHTVTTTSNASVSASLSVLLFRCSTYSDPQVRKDFFLLGTGLELYEAQKGCELWHHLRSHFTPRGMRWLWEWEEAWSSARHEQQESITALRGRLEDLSLKLKESGVSLSLKQILLKFIILVCTGPYHSVFQSVRDKICLTNDPEWDLETACIKNVEHRLSTILRQSDFCEASTQLKRGFYPKQGRGSRGTEGNGESDESGWESWMGKKNLTPTEGKKVVTAFTCGLCRSKGHCLTKCPVAREAGFIITKGETKPAAKNNRRSGGSTPPPSGPTSSSTKPGGPSIRFSESTKPPTPAAPATCPPVTTPGGKPVAGRIAETASLASGDGDASDTSLSSEDDVGWNAPNAAAVTAVEAARVRSNMAAVSFDTVARARKVRKLQPHRRGDARGRGGRGRGGEVSSPRPSSVVSGLEAASSSIWTPDVLARDRKPSSERSSYLCADSGASRDLFVQREWFEDYTDVRAKNKFVVVADDTKVLIHGIGTVRFNLAGHEVLLRKVYHVPGLNGSLLSIRTHRRRGEGCTFLADHTGCFLTFPSFFLPIDDEDDVILPCGPSRGGTLEYSQPLPSSQVLSAARRTASHTHATCRRSRISSSAPHLLRPEPISAKSDLDSTIDAVLPTHYIPESSSGAESRYSTADLHRLFGCRKFDYSTLPFLGSGLHVTSDREPALTIGDTVNINRGARGGPVTRPPRARHTIGADIGYGEGVGPGGFKYCLFLVDLATRYTWVYGLTDLSGECITDALWRFFVDAGGFPKRFRCDFDRRFLHGKVGRLLRSHGVKIGASPPHRQSQNGAVERHWNTAVEMGRAFLAEANLPKRYWFWAVREASIRMNMLPVKSGPALDDAAEFQNIPEDDDPSSIPRANLVSSEGLPPTRKKAKQRGRAKSAEAKARQWSTPMELYYGVSPDYRVLFKFGSIGYFRRTIESSGKSKSKFSSKSHFGIALGRSDYTNGMMFWDPTTSSFSVSADFQLDPDRGLSDPFPGIMYDGGMTPSLLSGTTPPQEPFPPGSNVFALIENDIYEGTVTSVPTPNCPWYVFLPTGSADTFPVAPCDISSPDDPMFPMDRNLDSSSEMPSLPRWMTQGSHLTIESDGALRKGCLGLTDSGTWEFFQRDGTGQLFYRVDLGDLPYTWRSRLLDGSLRLGWEAPCSRAYHVHAGGLRRGVPGSFRLSMRKDYVDNGIWSDSYTEEYVSLRDKQTFSSLTWDEYNSKYGHIKIIPSMCVQTVKNDEVGIPLRAKSRVVALGNFEDTIWEPGDLYAPVLRKESDRLLTSMAVDMGRTQKQGDCKTAFLHPTLPPDEIVIVRPPPGCPFSSAGELWLLNKTLYGLRRSPKHWYDALCAALIFIGLTPMPHDPCVFTGTLIPGGPPLYLGVYVDDFTYFSASDEVERVFEAALSSQLTIDWMGEVGWFLGKAYEWTRTPDDRLCVTITQTAKIEAMLEDNHMSDCNSVRSPYRSGLVIDSIPHDGADPGTKPEIVKPYQRLVGGLNWLSTSTRPDLSVAVSLLSQFSHNPSDGHLEAARYVLKYLQGTKDHGIRFIQSYCFTDDLIDWPGRPPGTSECVAFTDANWGPQDASHPPTDRVIHISEDSVRSLLGHVIIRCGGPVAWGAMREPRSSHSSCEAEIFAMDEGTKTVRLVRNIMTDLGLPDATHPTPLYNDNRGSVDWSRGASLSKRLRHMNIREVCVRDGVRLHETAVDHIPGHSNVADIFTKEHKSSVTFTHLASQLIFPRFHSSRVEDDKENHPPRGNNNQNHIINGETSHIAQRAKRGRIKGGARTGLDSPACLVHSNHVDLYILSG